MHTVAWLAGLFEGEGSISRASGASRTGWRLSLTSTDYDVIVTVAQVAGCGRINGPYRRHNSTKDFWTWNLAAASDVLAVLQEMHPFLHERRQARADVAIADLDRLVNARSLCKAGLHPKLGPGKCLECKAEYQRQRRRAATKGQ